MCIEYQLPIRDMDELRPRPVETWAEFQHSVVDNATDQWRVSMQKKVTTLELAVTLLA